MKIVRSIMKKTLRKKASSVPYTKILFFMILFAGIFARIWQLGLVPAGINQDEAFSGYEAYALLHFGKDSFGYSAPVYLTTWGSGMSALNTYLMIPFIAIFGLHTWVIRIPQFLVACLSVWVVYLIVKRVVNEGCALAAMFVTAVAPWHIMMSRWGLDCNLAPGFLLFGLYFFIRGLEKEKYFILSALMYGLSLYCYATIWPFVPLIIMLQVIYCVIYKKITFSKYTLLALLVLFLLACPLVLFLFVNWGMIPEIRLPFLSIPKLPVMRGNEISLSNIRENALNLWSIVASETDGLITNSTERFGMFYPISLPFFFFGLFWEIRDVVTKIRNKVFGTDIFLLIQLLAGVLLGCVIRVNINRVNILFLPMLITVGIGVYQLCKLIDIRYIMIPAAVYLLFFIQFEKYYFTEYKEESSWTFCEGLEEAVEEAISHEGTIYSVRDACYSRILFYIKQDVNEYIDTVVYRNYPAAYLDVDSFGRFQFMYEDRPLDTAGIYIAYAGTDSTQYVNAGFTVLYFKNYMVAFVE